MNTELFAPQYSVSDLLAGLKALFSKLIADPNLFPNIENLWEAFTRFWKSPAPQASAEDEAIVRGWLAELPPRAGEPEKLFDGKIIAFIVGVKAWIDAHPEAVAFLLQVLAWIG